MSAVPARSQRLELIARAVALTTDEAIVFVSRRQVERLIEELRVVQKHIERYEAEIAEAFARHPSASLFASCPARKGPRAPPPGGLRHRSHPLRQCEPTPVLQWGSAGQGKERRPGLDPLALECTVV